jgi:hypothetical protein
MPYEAISVHDARLREVGVEPDGVLFGSTQLAIPAIAFGDTDPASLNLPNQDDSAEWPAKVIYLPEVYRFRIKNAIVHPPFGIITIDSFVLRETLGHIPFHHEGYGRNGDEIVLPTTGIGAILGGAVHVMGGNYDNYYHLIADILTKLQVEPLSPYHFTGTVLLPPIVTPPLRDIAMRLAQAGKPVYSLSYHSVQVQALRFIENLSAWGSAPNPHLAPFFHSIKQLFGIDEVPTHKIYITRKDSQSRILLNEDDVIATVQRHGFQVVELSGLDLVAQMRLFAGASHIIAPHGAGLANLAFCGPGTSVCELHMDTYLNWCFRRLCSILEIKYGCLVGSVDPEYHQSWMHHMRWSLPLSKLESVLVDRGFVH